MPLADLSKYMHNKRKIGSCMSLFFRCAKRVERKSEVAAAAENEDQPDQGAASASVAVVVEQTNTVSASIVIVAADG